MFDFLDAGGTDGGLHASAEADAKQLASVQVSGVRQVGRGRGRGRGGGGAGLNRHEYLIEHGGLAKWEQSWH